MRRKSGGNFRVCFEVPMTLQAVLVCDFRENVLAVVFPMTGCALQVFMSGMLVRMMFRSRMTLQTSTVIDGRMVDGIGIQITCENALHW